MAKRVILLTLPNQDRAYVKGSLTLNEIWGKLLAKYMPSTDAEARKLWSRFIALRQADRPVVEHVNECMTVRNYLIAVGETVPEKQFVDKLLNIDRELSYLRPMLVCAPIDNIVAGLTDGYSYHYHDRQHQHQHGNAGRGRFQCRHPRGQGAPAAAADAPAMAAVKAGAGGEERRCYNCNQQGHLLEDCDKLHPEVRQWLKQQAARGRGRGRGRSRGRGRGGPAVAAISTADVQHIVDSLPGESSAFLPDKWLVDSGADLNICFNYELFSYTGPSDVDICTPIGNSPLDVLGRGVVKMCVGHYVIHNGLSHPIDLEIEDVYWVPQCPMHVLATPCIAEQNMYLYTGPQGNALYIPGFADQSLGVFGKCTQEMDHDGNSVIGFNLGKGRPIMNTHPVDDGRVWSHVSDMLHNNDAACEIAAVQNEGMEYVTAFMAHLAYGHCCDAAMQLNAQAPELYGHVLANDHVKGMRGQGKGCHLAGQVKRNQGLQQGKLVGRATTPGKSLHADVVGPIVPMGIGTAKYVLVVVDECTRYSWVFPVRKNAQTAWLLALLIQRINTQVRRPGDPGVRRLHIDQGGEFKLTSLEEFCQWKGIVHTFTDRAQHQSNGLVERKIGQLNESTRAAVLANDLPAYLWPEVYMATCHTQNIVPISALQRELKKEKKEQFEKKVKKDGEEGQLLGSRGMLLPRLRLNRGRCL